MPIRQSAPPYDWFTHGRRQAGMGWYTPGPSRFAAIAAPAVQGAAQGLGYYMGNRPLTEQLNAGQPVTPEVFGSQDMPPGTTMGGATGTADILSGRTPGYADPITQNPAVHSPPAAVPNETGYWPGDRVPGETIEQRAKRLQQRWKWQQLAAYSSRTLKDDITRADERRSLREVMQTPVYTYRYTDEATPARIGPMAEEVPERWQTQVNGRAGIKMPVMLGALHAATRALARDVRSLKEQLRG